MRNLEGGLRPVFLFALWISISVILARGEAARADDSGKYVGRWENDTSLSKVVSQGGQTWMCDRPHDGPLTYVVSSQSVADKEYNCQTVSRKEGGFELACAVGTQQIATISATIASGRITGTWRRSGGTVECAGTISLTRDTAAPPN